MKITYLLRFIAPTNINLKQFVRTVCGRCGLFEK